LHSGVKGKRIWASFVTLDSQTKETSGKNSKLEKFLPLSGRGEILTDLFFHPKEK